jgi:hypothetical protein
MSDTTETQDPTYCEACDTVHAQWEPNEDGTYGQLHTTRDDVEFYQFVSQAALSYIQDEMTRQINKWGVQNHPSFQLQEGGQHKSLYEVDSFHFMPDEATAKGTAEYRAKDGTIVWCDILQEELSEALGAAYNNNDPNAVSDEAFGELVQVTAVAFAWLTNVLFQRRGDKLRDDMEQQNVASAEMERLFSAISGSFDPEGDETGYEERDTYGDDD